MSDEETNMRDDFDAAIESIGFEEDEVKSEVIMPEEVPDDLEAESNSEPTKAPETATEEAPETTIEAQDTGEETPIAAETSEIAAPMGFSPASREEWKNVPQVVKEQIQKQENDIRNAMANTKEAKNTHSRISKLADGYAPILASEGVDNPLDAVEGLFKTVAELRMGSPAQKAAKMGQLINHYGIDIGMLDQSLTGAQVVDTPENQFSSLIDKKMAPMNQILEQLNQIQAGKAQESTAAVNQEVEQFSQNAEFINEVRNDMADLIDMANNRGQDLSLKDAYDRACSFHPEISGILKQRQDAESLLTSQNSIAAKRSAGSSVAGYKSGGGVKPATSLRDQISQAWDNQLDG